MNLNTFKDELLKQAGLFSTVSKTISKPWVKGTLVGGGLGAGVGAIAAPQDQKLKGAITGGLVGAVGGGVLGHYSRPVKIIATTPETRFMKDISTKAKDTTGLHNKMEGKINKNIQDVRNAMDTQAGFSEGKSLIPDKISMSEHLPNISEKTFLRNQKTLPVNSFDLKNMISTKGKNTPKGLLKRIFS
jgi:hypothetical protein